LLVGLSTVRKEIAHQRENALAFGVCGNHSMKSSSPDSSFIFGN
jgi:hypothetical protein